MPPRKIDLLAAGERLAGPWRPVVAGEVNDAQVKLAWFEGTFDWHSHPAEDEGFLVLRGRIAIEFRDGRAELGEGEFMVVPRGVEHRPSAVGDGALVLMFEPASTLNTGDAVSDRTLTDLARL